MKVPCNVAFTGFPFGLENFKKMTVRLETWRNPKNLCFYLRMLNEQNDVSSHCSVCLLGWLVA